VVAEEAEEWERQPVEMQQMLVEAKGEEAEVEAEELSEIRGNYEGELWATGEKPNQPGMEHPEAAS
jgi:hypothetical protein